MTRHLAVPLFLLACLLLGGASAGGLVANLLLQLVAIILLSWVSWHVIHNGIPRSIRAPIILLGLLITVALVQLIPLPPSVWTALPGREAVVDGFRLLGVTLPWLPLALAPHNAVASLLWLLPAIAVFLLIIVLGAFRGRTVAGVIVGVAVLSVALGAVQIVGGGSGYIYEVTNRGAAVGFFANSNHNATLLLVSIPFLAALQKALLRRRRSSRNVSAIRVAVAGGYAVILVGLLINASLAGLGLAVPVVLGTWLVFGSPRPALRKAGVGLAVAGTLGVLLAIASGSFGDNLFAPEEAQAEASRQVIFARTWEAAQVYLPFGSGIGSFEAIYPSFEPLEGVSRFYVNHAHNDWLELLLETGLAGAALAALFLAWWIVRLRAIWGADEREPFAQAAVIASATIMVHSLVDYPLRTAGLSAVFAMCLGLMSSVRPYVRPRPPSPDKGGAKHLTI